MLNTAFPRPPPSTRGSQQAATALRIARSKHAANSMVDAVSAAAAAYRYDVFTLLFDEETSARESLIQHELQNLGSILQVANVNFEQKIIQPLRTYVFTGETSHRVRLRQDEDATFKRLLADFKNGRAKLSLSTFSSPSEQARHEPVPRPPDGARAHQRPSSSSWISRRTPVQDTTSAEAVEAAEASSRTHLEDVEVAIRHELKTAKDKADAEVSAYLLQRAHTKRLEKWRCERDERLRHQELMAIRVQALLTLQSEESQQRLKLETDITLLHTQILNQASQDLKSLHRVAVMHDFLSDRRTFWLREILPERIALVVLQETLHRQWRWETERVIDVDLLFRPRAIELRRLYVQSLTIRGTVLILQNFYRKWRLGLTGWRRSHKIVGQTIMQLRHQRQLRAEAEQRHAVVEVVREKLNDALKPIDCACDRLIAMESIARQQICSDRDWEHFNIVEHTRFQAVSVVRPLLRQCATQQSVARLAITDAEAVFREQLISASRSCGLAIAAKDTCAGTEANQRGAIARHEAVERSTLLSALGDTLKDAVMTRRAQLATSATDTVTIEATSRAELIAVEAAQRAERFSVPALYGPQVETDFMRSLSGLQLLKSWSCGVTEIVELFALKLHSALGMENARHHWTALFLTAKSILWRLEIERRNTILADEVYESNRVATQMRVEHVTLAALLKKRNSAARVIQRSVRMAAKGQLGRTGMKTMLHAKYAFKRDRAECKADLSRTKAHVHDVKSKLAAALCEDEEARRDALYRMMLQLNREESWSRSTLLHEEEWSWWYSLRDLSDSLLDHVDAQMRATKDQEFADRRTLWRDESLGWETIRRQIVWSLRDLNARPIQRAIRCFLARRARRAMIAFRLDDLPNREAQARRSLYSEVASACAVCQRELISLPLDSERRSILVDFLVGECEGKARALAESEKEMRQRIYFEQVHARRSQVLEAERIEFEGLTTTFWKKSLEAVSLLDIALSERYLIAAEECSARIRKTVVAFEILVRAELEVDVMASLSALHFSLAEALRRDEIEVQQIDDRAILLRHHESSTREATEARLLTLHCSFALQHAEELKRLVSQAAESHDRRLLLVDAESVVREVSVDLPERNARNRLRLEAMESVARADLVVQWLSALAAVSVAEDETAWRADTVRKLGLSQYEQLMWLVERSFQEKQTNYSEALFDADRQNVIDEIESSHRSALWAEFCSALPSMQSAHFVAALDCVRMTAQRVRREDEAAEQVNRDRIAAAEESMRAHTAASVIQTRWLKTRDNRKPASSPQSDNSFANASAEHIASETTNRSTLGVDEVDQRRELCAAFAVETHVRLLAALACKMMQLQRDSVAEVEAATRRDIHRSEQAATDVLAGCAERHALLSFSLALLEANERSAMHDEAMRWYQDLEQREAFHQQQCEVLLIDEDTARYQIEEQCAEHLNRLGTFFIESRNNALHQWRKRSVNEIQRWWKQISMMGHTEAAVADALFLRDTLAADEHAARELREFAEALNQSVTVIQSVVRMRAAKRKVALLRANRSGERAAAAGGHFAPVAAAASESDDDFVL